MRIRLIFTAGLYVLTMSGCFFHGGYPNGYYGPGPSVLPQQPSTGLPGGPFYQPYNQPGLNGGQPYVPGSSPGSGGPTLTNPGSTPTYDTPPGTNGNAPNFDPNAPAGSGGKSVPLPGDDPAGYERGTKRPTLTPTSAIEPDRETSIGQKESRRLAQPYTDSSETVGETEEEFHSPEVRQASGVDDGDVHFANGQTAAARVAAKPYAHDPDFEWVQGTVDFDKSTQTWFIMYDDNPKSSDKLGGDLTLADDPSLARLRPGDAVRIEGTLDESEGDSRGKPLFRMTRFKRL